MGVKVGGPLMHMSWVVTCNQRHVRIPVRMSAAAAGSLHVQRAAAYCWRRRSHRAARPGCVVQSIPACCEPNAINDS